MEPIRHGGVLSMLLDRYLFTQLSNPALSDKAFIRHLKEAMNSQFFDVCTSEDASLTLKKHVYPIIQRMASVRPSYMESIPLTYFIEIDKPLLYSKKITKDNRQEFVSIIRKEHVPYIERHLSDFALKHRYDIFNILSESVTLALLEQSSYQELFLEYVNAMLPHSNSSFQWKLSNLFLEKPELMPQVLSLIQQHCQTPPYTFTIWESLLTYIQLDTFDDVFIQQLLHLDNPQYSDPEHALFSAIRNWSEHTIVVSENLQRLVDQLPECPSVLLFLQNGKNRKIRGYLPDVHSLTESDLLYLFRNVDLDDITLESFEKKELQNPDTTNTTVYMEWLDDLSKQKDKVKACRNFLEKVGFGAWYEDILAYRAHTKHLISLNLLPAHSLYTFQEVLNSRKKWIGHIVNNEVELHL